MTKSLIAIALEVTASLDKCIDILEAPLEERVRTQRESRVLMTLKRLRVEMDGN